MLKDVLGFLLWSGINKDLKMSRYGKQSSRCISPRFRIEKLFQVFSSKYVNKVKNRVNKIMLVRLGCVHSKY